MLQSCDICPAALLALVEYEVDVEVTVTDVLTVDNLRKLFDDGNFSLALSPAVNITNIDITTGKNGASAEVF